MRHARASTPPTPAANGAEHEGARAIPCSEVLNTSMTSVRASSECLHPSHPWRQSPTARGATTHHGTTHWQINSTAVSNSHITLPCLMASLLSTATRVAGAVGQAATCCRIRFTRPTRINASWSSALRASAPTALLAADAVRSSPSASKVGNTTAAPTSRSAA